MDKTGIYKDWLEYTAHAAGQNLWLLEEVGDVLLFKLTTDDQYSRHGGFSSVTFHVWNRKTAKHQVFLGYKEAYHTWKSSLELGGRKFIRRSTAPPCRPSVENCLNCMRENCDPAYKIPLDDSERDAVARALAQAPKQKLK